MKRIRKQTVGFGDLPKRLQPREGESRERVRERFDWLEEHGLAVVDYLAWKRAQHPLAEKRPPARRKLLTPKQLAELDARLEAEKERAADEV